MFHKIKPMKKIIFLFISALWVISGFEISAKQKLKVDSLKELNREFTAQMLQYVRYRSESEDGKEPCAIIKTALGNGVKVEGDIYGEPVNRGNGELWIYVPQYAKQIRITHEYYDPLKIEFASTPGFEGDTILAGKTYELSIAGFQMRPVRLFINGGQGMSDYEVFEDFTITISDGVTADHHYVDLGLPSGTKWATCNLGAESNDQPGNFYSWGEIYPKKVYTSNTLQEAIKDVIFDDKPIRKEYDAANAAWGGSWRLPTDEEAQELMDLCTRQLVLVNGRWGVKLTGLNGHSIFLPPAGHMEGVNLNGPEALGYYWTSNSVNGSSNNAIAFFFGTGSFIKNANARWRGFSIRPVCD